MYVVAGLGIYLVVTDALARRRAGVGFWPTDAAFRQGPVTFVLFVPIAVVVYLASWIGWLATDGGWDRHSAELAPATGVWSWVPSAFHSLWLYHRAIYDFHVGLSSAHAYASRRGSGPFCCAPRRCTQRRRPTVRPAVFPRTGASRTSTACRTR
ncbi:hypothetical protein [Microbacterium terregens]|uniref:hypothetical protein n=1 Tax=Microbacterium terregens TaxID=69363 RepID=UPI0031DC20F6